MDDLQTKHFSKLDEGFECVNCGKQVKPLKYTSRDHCPHCLHSLHVDNFPGDRSNTCRGILEPIGVEKNKKGYQIVYKCTKCGQTKKNILAEDDNFNMVIKISSHNAR